MLPVDPMDVFCVGLMIVVFASIVGGYVYVKKSAKRFAPDGALADAFADADQRFSLDMPEGGPVDLYVHYSLRATPRSGGGISYGMIMRLDVEREPAASGYRDAQPFVLSHEYLFGQAHRGFGEVPIAECVDAGPSMRAGLEMTRGVLVAHLPAGGRLKARGRIAASGATEIQSFLLFTKPPRRSSSR